MARGSSPHQQWRSGSYGFRLGDEAQPVCGFLWILATQDSLSLKISCFINSLIGCRWQNNIACYLRRRIAKCRLMFASKIKSLSSGKLMVVAPAIRPLGSPADDQKRIATPSMAIKAGADYLVIGRPITVANDPKEAAHKIIVEMADSMRELGEGTSAH
jgi:hypothetical protein